MKRLFILLVLMTAVISVKSQNMYICISNNANVRKGPGKNYSILRTNTQMQGYWQIPQKEIVRYLGKKKNGYMYVEGMSPVDGSMQCEVVAGWVYAKFFKPMTKKCNACKGKGYFERPCGGDRDSEHPYFCICHREILTPYGSVGLNGRQICEKCGGYGYLK